MGHLYGPVLSRKWLKNTIMQEYAEYAQIWAYSTLKCHNFCSVEYFPVIVSDY